MNPLPKNINELLDAHYIPIKQKGLIVIYENLGTQHTIYYLVNPHGLPGIITEEMPEELKT